MVIKFFSSSLVQSSAIALILNVSSLFAQDKVEKGLDYLSLTDKSSADFSDLRKDSEKAYKNMTNFKRAIDEKSLESYKKIKGVGGVNFGDLIEAREKHRHMLNNYEKVYEYTNTIQTSLGESGALASQELQALFFVARNKLKFPGVKTKSKKALAWEGLRNGGEIMIKDVTPAALKISKQTFLKPYAKTWEAGKKAFGGVGSRHYQGFKNVKQYQTIIESVKPLTVELYDVAMGKKSNKKSTIALMDAGIQFKKILLDLKEQDPNFGQHESMYKSAKTFLKLLDDAEKFEASLKLLKSNDSKLLSDGELNYLTASTGITFFDLATGVTKLLKEAKNPIADNEFVKTSLDILSAAKNMMNAGYFRPEGKLIKQRTADLDRIADALLNNSKVFNETMEIAVGNNYSRNKEKAEKLIEFNNSKTSPNLRAETKNNELTKDQKNNRNDDVKEEVVLEDVRNGRANIHNQFGEGFYVIPKDATKTGIESQKFARTEHLGSGNRTTSRPIGNIQQRKQHLSWGRWSGRLNDDTNRNQINTTATQGYWIAGRMTPAQNIPRSGEGFYRGVVRGTAYTSGGSSHDLSGNFDMRFTFGSGILTGSFDNLSYLDNGRRVVITNNSREIIQIGDGSIQGNRFGGSLGGSVSSQFNSPIGSLSGAFYGNNAENVGGVFSLNTSDNGTSASGIFSGDQRAKEKLDTIPTFGDGGTF